MVELVLCYGSEVWTLNVDLKERLMAVEVKEKCQTEYIGK